MMPFAQEQASVFNSAFACGFRNELGRVSVSWGNEAPQDLRNKMRLSFRFFHKSESSGEHESLWSGFPREGVISGENFFQFSDALVPPTSGILLETGFEAPSYSDWANFCERINQEIIAKRMEKVVPARSKIYQVSLEQESRLKKNLLEIIFSSYSPGTFPFFLKWRESVFFGISPELLFKRSEDTLYVPAIAGTRKIPADEMAAREIANGLLQDEKELHEHKLVVDGILQSLAGIGISAKAATTEPQPLFLRGLVHLKTEIYAKHGGASSERIIHALHPTPAVSGYPKERSKDFLAAHEPIDRGLFAAPLLFSQEKEEYCIVGIRSALLSRGKLMFMAGAGFVKGSTPEGEWNETERKMDFLRGLLEGRS